MRVVRKVFDRPRRDRAYSAFLVLPILSILCLIANPAPAKERRAAVTVDVKLNAPPGAQTVRLWVPYPVSDSNQDIAAPCTPLRSRNVYCMKMNCIQYPVCV